MFCNEYYEQQPVHYGIQNYPNKFYSEGLTEHDSTIEL